MATLSLKFLGRFQASLGDEPAPEFRISKVQALLIYLASEPGPHSRDSLMELLWPGLPARSARVNLRQILYQLRKAIPEVSSGEGGQSDNVPLLMANRQEIRLNPAAAVEVDLLQFERLLDRTQSHQHPGLLECQSCQGDLERAVGLYRGDFSADFYLDDSSVFESWAHQRREGARHKVQDALELLTTIYIHQKEYGQARSYAERQLTIDDLREPAYRQLMEIMVLSGQRSEAAAVYEEYRQRLAEELGMEPSKRTTAMFQSILAGELGVESPLEQRIRGFELREEIGQGAFGAIHLANQPSVDREVVVKVIRQQYANDPDFIRRFENEAQTVARLEHPHIVPLYDYWRDPDGAYLVMRYLRGGSLLSALEPGPWEPAQAGTMLDQVAGALSAAHRQGVVHRDIKPANILLDEEGNCYLTDFGIAKDLTEEAKLTATGAVVGTLDYISPEQILNEELTGRADIYSLGAVLYETLTGEKPFPDSSVANLLHSHLKEPLPLVSASQPDIPAEVDEVIQRATAKRPADRYATALEMAAAFRAALQGVGAEVVEPLITPEVVEIYNPYKGLRAFQEADADDFYGREGLVEQLISGVADSRFLAVVGPSGGGKSSAVKAGLIPALRKGAIPSRDGMARSDKWFVAEMTPGAHPLDELELALWPVAVDPPPSLVEPMQHDTRGLSRTIRRILPDEEGAHAGHGPQLLLVIDQFEELFTLVEDEEEREFFIDSLLTAVRDPRGPLRVVVTLRADFYDRPLQMQSLGKLLKENTEIVLPMTAEELTWAVREPARRMGVGLEPGLAEAIVADVSDQPGGLPLLQYALTELFDKRQERRMNGAVYQEIGRVIGALGRRADEITRGLDEQGQAAARQLFLRLVTLGEGVEDTRRRVLRSELTALAGALREAPLQGEAPLQAVDAVIDEYGRARLLTFDRDPVTREPTVEVAHEALLREWRQLRAWLDESRNDVRTLRMLSLAAADWLDSGQDDSYLLRGSRLELFAGWAESSTVALTGEEQRFLAASIAAREARQAEEEARRQQELETAQKLAETESARAEEQSQAAGRLRRRAYVLGGVLAVAVLLAIAAFFFAQQSSENATVAEQNAIEAQDNAQLAATREAEAVAEAEQRATAQAEADQQRNAALVAQEEAQAEADFRATAEAVAMEEREAAEEQRAIAEQERDLTRSRELALAALNNLDKDPERSIMLAMEAINTTYTREAEEALHQAIQASYVRQTLFGHDGETGQLAYTPDGMRLVSTSYDGTAKVWDLATGSELITFDSHDDLVLTVAIDPTGEWAVTGSADGTAKRWDLTTGEEQLTFPDFKTDFQGRLALSPDGALLATPSRDNTVKIWDAGTAEVLQTFSQPEFFRFVEFSPDGQLLASSGSDDEIARLWRVDTGEMISEIPQTIAYTNATFSPDNRLMATIHATEPEITIWDLEAFRDTGELQEKIRLALADSQYAMGAFTPDSQYFISESGADSGEARVYDVSTGEILHSFYSDEPGSLWWPAASPDGQRVAFGGISGVINIWSVAPTGNPEIPDLLAHDNDPWLVFRMDTTLDRSRLATVALRDGTARLWDLETRELLLTTPGHDSFSIAVSVSSDGSKLATGDELEPIVKVWDVATGEELAVLEHGPATDPDYIISGIGQVDFNPMDDRYLATAGGDGTARIWDLETGEETLVVRPHPQDEAVTVVNFSPDGTRLATGTNQPNALVKIWDAVTGEELAAMTGLPTTVFGLRYSPDGKMLAAVGPAGYVRLWDAETGEEIAPIAGHAGPLFGGVAFSPDGSRLATASADNTIKIWDTGTGAELLRLTTHFAPNAVLFSGDGSQLIVSARGDGVIHFYAMMLPDLMEIAKSRITRPMTSTECEQYRIDPCPAEQ